jgi:hypothetical protein
MMPAKIVWVVSFAVDEEGQFLDYAVDEFDLTQCSSTVAGHLQELMGQGVFGDLEDAERWAKEQTQETSCCHKQTGARTCPCSKSKG